MKKSTTMELSAAPGERTVDAHMRVRCRIVPLYLVAFALIASPAVAQTRVDFSSASPGLVSSLVPELVTMEQKLVASDQVFVGIGRRVYLRDRSGREIALGADSAEAPVGDGWQAILEVAIEQELQGSNAQRASAVANFLLEVPVGIGAKPATYDDLAGRVIGKQTIYFARRLLPPVNEFAGVADQRALLPGLLSLVSTPARQGPVDNPLSITELQTVMNAMLINGHNTEDPNCF